MERRGIIVPRAVMVQRRQMAAPWAGRCRASRRAM